jgi:phosphate transport system protein
MWRNLFNVFRKDTLFTQALRESHQMLDIDLEMFEASVESLRRSDAGAGAINVDLRKMDKEINRFERDVREKVLTHLAVSGPSDLSHGLVLVSIIIDIERIGDYAKNIYDLARYHPERLHGGSMEEVVADVESRTASLFRDMVVAFRENDQDKARKIMKTYKGSLSTDCEKIVERLVGDQASDLTAGNAAAIALYVRYLKRIAGHSRNIVTSVVNPFPRIGYREKKVKKEY